MVGQKVPRPYVHLVVIDECSAASSVRPTCEPSAKTVDVQLGGQGFRIAAYKALSTR